jgi:class II lanthipeptide synthase
VITGGRRRRNWSEAEKARIVAESADAEANVSEAPRRNGVSRSFLNVWRRRPRLGRRQGSGKVRAGRVLVERQGLTVEVAPEACVPPIAEPLTCPVEVSLQLPNARPNLSPGYYLVAGRAPIAQGDSLVRLYWHLTPEGAANWLRRATEALNARNLPFRLKVVHAPQLFTRCDAGVLYLPQSAFAAARAALRDIYAHVEAQLRPPVPAFTWSLALGLGLAESPGGESFGLHRCGLIADGLVRSRTEGRADTADRLGCVLACWADAGLDIERPYLNPGSKDVYETLRSPTRRNATVASSTEREQAIHPDDCLEVAAEIGTQLAREAIWHGDRCTWLGAEMLAPGVTCYGTLCPDVYSGIAGVGIECVKFCKRRSWVCWAMRPGGGWPFCAP